MTYTQIVAVAAAALDAADEVTSAAIDLTDAVAAELHFDIDNGAAGPATECVMTPLFSTSEAGQYNAGMPVGGGIANNRQTRRVMSIPAAAGWLKVHFAGHTTQPVNIRAVVGKKTL